MLKCSEVCWGAAALRALRPLGARGDPRHLCPPGLREGSPGAEEDLLTWPASGRGRRYRPRDVTLDCFALLCCAQACRWCPAWGRSRCYTAGWRWQVAPAGPQMRRLRSPSWRGAGRRRTRARRSQTRLEADSPGGACFSICAWHLQPAARTARAGAVCSTAVTDGKPCMRVASSACLPT